MNIFKILCRVVVTVIALLGLCGCGMIDFREKSLATETKVVGLDAEIPGSFNSGASLAIVRLGYISHKYMSAPDGGKATINDEYNGINIWKLSGNGKSKLSVENSTNYEPPTTNQNDSLSKNSRNK